MAAIGSATLAATLAPAQAQFTAVYGFGDSYADTGAAPGGAFRIAGVSCIYGAICSFTDGITFVQALGTHYGLPGITNYAIGGARTNDTNTLNAEFTEEHLTFNPVPGFRSELKWSNSVRYASTDLIALSIGGNDLSASNASESVDDIKHDAVLSAGREVKGVQQMVGQGARNIVVFGTGSSVYFPVPPGAFGPDQRNGWAETYYEQTEEGLAPLAHSGVRIFLFDFRVLQERLHDNAAQYGFSTIPNCEAGPAPDGVPPAAGVAYDTPNCFYENTVHPTGAGMQLVADYMTNQIDAPTTVVSQGAIATSLATNFVGSVFGRLDAYRTVDQFDTSATSAIPGTASAKRLSPTAPESRWSVYGGASYSGGSGESQFLAAGYNYSAVGGSLGLDYRVDPSLRLGAVIGYSAPDVSLGVQNAHNHIDALQFAGYGSFTGANGFADALVAYGRDEFALDRRGVIDVIRGATGADVFTAAAQAGYLVDVGAMRIGPIAGIDYTHARIAAYRDRRQPADHDGGWPVGRQPDRRRRL